MGRRWNDPGPVYVLLFQRRITSCGTALIVMELVGLCELAPAKGSRVSTLPFAVLDSDFAGEDRSKQLGVRAGSAT